MEPATFRFIVQHLNYCATAVASGLLVTKYTSRLNK